LCVTPLGLEWEDAGKAEMASEGKEESNDKGASAGGIATRVRIVEMGMILLIYFRKSARVGKLGKNRQIIPNYSERNPGGISGILGGLTHQIKPGKGE